MELTDFLQGIFAKYPFLVVVGPLVGLLLAKIKATGKIQGFGLLGVSFLVTAVTLIAYGFADNWSAETWRKAPFGILVILAISELTTNATLHTRDAIAKVTAKKNGDGS